MTDVRVGIIGASPGASWAARSHVPAIAAAPGIRLTAVATSRTSTAVAAQAQFGAAHAFTDAVALAHCDEVDAVIVAVKVPEHERLVQAVLDAGKHLYCEWPLGVDTAQAEDLAARAGRAGVHDAVGLQARSSPTIRFLRDELRAGAIGQIESVAVTAFSTRGAFPISPTKRYLFDRSAGANLLTIETGHLLDALVWLLGDVVPLASVVRTARARIASTEGTELDVDTPDTVDAILRAKTGGSVSMHLAQGAGALTRTSISICGSEGAVRLVTTDAGGIQMAPLQLSRSASTAAAALEAWNVPPRYRRVPDLAEGPAVNVAEALTAFARDIRSGTRTIAGFGDAVAAHRRLDDLVRAGVGESG